MGKFRRVGRLWDAYRFPGFRPSSTVIGIFGDPTSRVITLSRRSKKRVARHAAWSIKDGTTAKCGGYATFPAATAGSIWMWKSGASTAGGAER
jgi:hypothetical protein